jgi:hypothetical protein
MNRFSGVAEVISRLETLGSHKNFGSPSHQGARKASNDCDWFRSREWDMVDSK